jgi:hypothetical protein
VIETAVMHEQLTSEYNYNRLKGLYGDDTVAGRGSSPLQPYVHFNFKFIFCGRVHFNFNFFCIVNVNLSL